MSEHLRSNVIGYVCLFWLMCGTAIAATTLPKASVGAKQIKANAVSGKKVLDNSLTGADVNESTLGLVPHAATADTASTATTATTAEDAARLGGSAAAAYQRRIDGACSGGGAVASINADGTVSCEAGAGGDITAVTAGTGLSGGGTAGAVSLAVNPSATQSRVTGTCGAGSAIASIAQAGTVGCNSFPTALPPTGAAGGDLSSTYPNPAIATNAVNSPEVVDNSLTGTDINESTLAQVPDSASLGGQPASAYAPTAAEAFREVGAAGQPAFQNGWSNVGAGSTTVAFFKDPFGIVHLKGTVNGPGSGPPAFTLPVGYRPGVLASFPTVTFGSATTVANALIAANGEVSIYCDPSPAPCTALDGVTFRAGS